MKNEKVKITKFSLEKFEVARLSNMKSIKGGDGDTLVTGTDGDFTSSNDCLPPPPTLNKTISQRPTNVNTTSV